MPFSSSGPKINSRTASRKERDTDDDDDLRSLGDVHPRFFQLHLPIPFDSRHETIAVPFYFLFYSARWLIVLSAGI